MLQRGIARFDANEVVVYHRMSLGLAEDTRRWIDQRHESAMAGTHDDAADIRHVVEDECLDVMAVRRGRTRVPHDVHARHTLRTQLAIGRRHLEHRLGHAAESIKEIVPEQYAHVDASLRHALERLEERQARLELERAPKERHLDPESLRYSLEILDQRLAQFEVAEEELDMGCCGSGHERERDGDGSGSRAASK